MNPTTPLLTMHRLGTTGPMVSRLGFGCMGLSGRYRRTPDDEGVATIERALERGITPFDTGDFYGQGHNEMLLRRALGGRRGRVQLSVKFGAMRGPDGSWIVVDTTPRGREKLRGFQPEAPRGRRAPAGLRRRSRPDAGAALLCVGPRYAPAPMAHLDSER